LTDRNLRAGNDGRLSTPRAIGELTTVSIKVGACAVERPGCLGRGAEAVRPPPHGRQPPKAPIWEAAAFFSTVASAEAS
jgi:hypothetical protein